MVEKPSTSKYFGSSTPLQVQVNFDIPLFKGKIDAEALEKIVSLLEDYYVVQNFSDNDKITFSLLKCIPHVKYWWQGYWERLNEDESRGYEGCPT